MPLPFLYQSAGRTAPTSGPITLLVQQKLCHTALRRRNCGLGRSGVECAIRRCLMGVMFAWCLFLVLGSSVLHWLHPVSRRLLIVIWMRFSPASTVKIIVTSEII